MLQNILQSLTYCIHLNGLVLPKEEEVTKSLYKHVRAQKDRRALPLLTVASR